MTEVLEAASALESTPRAESPTIDPKKQELSRTLQAKVAHGYRIESLTDTRAVVVMKGYRRWFGLDRGKDERSEITINESGRATSRRI